jgi:aminocarboxymuconate-semialdehyde decarboxylase
VPELVQRLRSYYLTNLIGNPMDTTIAAASLIRRRAEGVPAAEGYLAHGGGACLTSRAVGSTAGASATRAARIPPAPSTSLLYFDSLSTTPRRSTSAQGWTRACGGHRLPLRHGQLWFCQCCRGLTGIAQDAKSLILGNAQTLFGTPARPPAVRC